MTPTDSQGAAPAGARDENVPMSSNSRKELDITASSATCGSESKPIFPGNPSRYCIRPRNHHGHHMDAECWWGPGMGWSYRDEAEYVDRTQAELADLRARLATAERERDELVAAWDDLMLYVYKPDGDTPYKEPLARMRKAVDAIRAALSSPSAVSPKEGKP